MRKLFKVLFTFVILFLFTSKVSADLGEARYEITDVTIADSVITFKGWAFIHRTQNFTKVVDSDGKTVTVENSYGKITNGDQKILIQAISNGKVVETKVVSGGSDNKNYNFYCQMFFKYTGWYGSPENEVTKTDLCVASAYNGSNFLYLNSAYSPDNKCSSATESNCYYEDMDFSISFDVSKWNLSDNAQVSFKIGVSNADFEMRVNKGDYKGSVYSYNGDKFTSLENLFLNKSVVSKSNGNLIGNNFISIVDDSVSNQVQFIASRAILMYWYDNTGIGSERYGAVKSKYYVADTLSQGSYSYGYLASVKNSELGYKFYSGTTYSPGKYAIYTKSDTDDTPCSNANGSGCTVRSAWGSWVKPSGNLSFSVNIKNNKYCNVVEKPSSRGLSCNGTNSYTSDCEELTVNTSEGSATIKLQQNGYLSNVVTPGKTYAGGGFSFSVTYYNTIKWSYVGSGYSSALKKAVASAMNDKIKDYNSYVAGLNLKNINFGGVTIDSGFLVKECSTTGSFTADNELTVACTFYIPDSILHYDGSVTYSNGTAINVGGVSNKYYTPLDYIYNKKTTNYVVRATVVGMNRIKDSAAKADSVNNNTMWTGNWDTTNNSFTCNITLYSLLTTDKGKNNFIYRPIDINNPFPNRNAGMNWFTWYSVDKNKEKLENTYSGAGSSNNYEGDNLEYSVILNNETIAAIKNYNKNNGSYLEWDNINITTDKSSFVDEFVERYGG